MDELKITVITCTYNSEKYISQCIESVLSQEYKKIEHIFIDGLSSDSTIDIIHRYYSKPQIFRRKDNGVYDAFNRALTLVNTEIFGFLHSDDFYADKYCLSRVADAFKNNPEIDYYSSQMIVWDSVSNKKIATLGGPMHNPTFGEKLRVSNYYAHPTVYCKKKVIDIVGNYDLQYRIAADIDWMNRLKSSELKQLYEGIPMLYLRNTGTSGSYIFKAILEERKISLKLEKSRLIVEIIFYFHFFRRFIRKVLEWSKLGFLIALARKILNK
jgi:glycosyltransferase